MTALSMLVERACLLDELHARRVEPVRMVPAPVDRSVRGVEARMVAGRER